MGWDIAAAHKHSFRNRVEIEASETCACFFCRVVFSPSEISEWTDTRSVPASGGEDTALCPKCQVDSVLGSASGYPVTDPLFLTSMHERWFK